MPPPFRRVFALLGLASVLLGNPVLATIHHVYNAGHFNNLPCLEAGDVVLMHDGEYDALDKALCSNILDDDTARTNPIRVLATNPGSVRVIAPSQITMRGRGIVLAGLDFTADSGMKVVDSDGPAFVIRLSPASRDMTISNVRFHNCSDGDGDGNWIHANGFNHTVEYCSFEGKNMPISNATVVFVREIDEAGTATQRNHVLHHCYFGERIASRSINGYEAIRVGDSTSQAYEMHVIVEHNVFYHTIWRLDGKAPNDMEIISNKSKGNQYRHNTFLESYGQLTLRHGDACTVDGNYFFGGGYYSGSSIKRREPNSYQSGVRIIGQDHIVRNNYLENLRGTRARSALVLLAGDPNFRDGNGRDVPGGKGYEPAHNAQIYNNTFIDCESMHFGFGPRGSKMPDGARIFNSAWQGSGDDSVGLVGGEGFMPLASGGNYIYHPAGKWGWEGLGHKTTSPDITESFDNYLRPTDRSPLVLAGQIDINLVACKDIRNLQRPTDANKRDVGCYEREVSGSGLKPLLRADVGPSFDGGPSGTYPAAHAFQMTDNQVVVEAENHSSETSGGGKSWEPVNESGASGGPGPNAMSTDNTGAKVDPPGISSPRLEYLIQVPSSGRYRIHVRGRGPTNSDDSIHVSINGSTMPFATLVVPASNPPAPAAAFGWVTSDSLLIPSGLQAVTIWMREDGAIIDKIVVNKGAAPTGTGPDESPRN
jgi:poly(beta-D-mannuronate) lyase